MPPVGLKSSAELAASHIAAAQQHTAGLLAVSYVGLAVGGSRARRAST